MTPYLKSRCWSKTLLVILLGSALLSTSAKSDTQDQLPDIGTTAGSTLSINQELVIGDFYVRQLRGGAPLIYDPLLMNYINQLGQRLVASADSVRTPFHFYLIRNDDINAFAFFGGNVVLHSSLLRISDNESQLASVIAHEISHVTQRHLARYLEAQRRNAPLTWASAIGSILIALANPQAGMAALSTTLAGAQQGIISFTQDNEKEADRIGITVLAKAGFDPQAMPAFMQKLVDQARYATRPPEILLTHPLPESRLADARNRANQLPPRVIHSSPDYFFAKVRALMMYSSMNNNVKNQLIIDLKKGNQREKNAAQYGQAIQAYENKHYDQARQQLQSLLSDDSQNIWYLDLMTDIDLGQRRAAQAVNRLQAASKQQPKSTILQLNLANAYLEANLPEKASQLLYRYTYDYADDVNGWDLLAKASAAQNKRDSELSARAESMALTGKLDQAISLLSQASAQVKAGSLDQARYDARIDQFRALQQRFKTLQK